LHFAASSLGLQKPKSYQHFNIQIKEQAVKDRKPYPPISLTSLFRSKSKNIRKTEQRSWKEMTGKDVILERELFIDTCSHECRRRLQDKYEIQGDIEQV